MSDKIVAKARTVIAGLDSPDVHRRAVAILDQIVDALRETDTSDLRGLWAFCVDDGSAAMEWVLRQDIRLGFSIELDESESGWYIIVGKRDDMICEHGHLSEAVVSDLVARFLQVARLHLPIDTPPAPVV